MQWTQILFWKEAERKHTLHPSQLNFVSLLIEHYADQSDICAGMVVTSSSPETLISKLSRLLFFGSGFFVVLFFLSFLSQKSFDQ